MADELRTDQLYRLDLGRVNAYLVDDGAVTLVDAGMPGDLSTLRAEIDAAGYAERDIDRVILTHFDVDHVGTLANLAFDEPIHAMEPDAGYLDGSQRPPLSNHKGILQRLLGRGLSRPSTEVRRVADGASVGEFTAYHTPGHTPGHAVYVHDGLGVAFLGDLAVASGGRLQAAPWYFAYSASESATSVRALADRGLTFEIAAPGHGWPITEDGSGALVEYARRLG